MRTVIVTGASSGIGRATATAFLEAGWLVGLAARRLDLLEEIAADHDTAIVLPLDVTDPDAIEAGFAEFMDSAGRLDCLFNNAGIFVPSAPIDEIAVDDWRQAVEVNLTGMFLCARAAFWLMRRQTPRGGRIINNGSVSAHVPRPGAAPYTATKHGVTGLTRQIALDGRASTSIADRSTSATQRRTWSGTWLVRRNQEERLRHLSWTSLMRPKPWCVWRNCRRRPMSCSRPSWPLGCLWLAAGSGGGRRMLRPDAWDARTAMRPDRHLDIAPKQMPACRTG